MYSLPLEVNGHGLWVLQAVQKLQAEDSGVSHFFSKVHAEQSCSSSCIRFHGPLLIHRLLSTNLAHVAT